MPAQRHYSTSPRKVPHSSDTEPYETPTRRRYRATDEVGSPSSSSCSSAESPRKRQRRESTKKYTKEIDLEALLRDVVTMPGNHDAIVALKVIPRDDKMTRTLVKRLISSAKLNVVQRSKRRRLKPLLETELYYQWLQELDYVVGAYEIALTAKQPGTRKRVTGLGRSSYAVLFHLYDEFVEEVNAHHDRPLAEECSESLLYPPTLTLVEEAKDPSTDARSEKAVRLAEKALQRIDEALANAVRRYKVECGRNNPGLATRMSSQEHTLVKGCCLLCEQTGFGTAEDDMGDVLMMETRSILTQWKSEYEDCEDQLDDSE